MEELKEKLISVIEGLELCHLTLDQKIEPYYRLVSYIHGYSEGKWSDNEESFSKFIEAMKYANELFDIYVPVVLVSLKKSAKAKGLDERTIRRRSK